MTIGICTQTLHIYRALHISEELHFWNETSLSLRSGFIMYWYNLIKSFHPVEPVSSSVT